MAKRVVRNVFWNVLRMSRGDFNMVEDLKHRFGGSICNSHLIGFQALSKLIQKQNLEETW